MHEGQNCLSYKKSFRKVFGYFTAKCDFYPRQHAFSYQLKTLTDSFAQFQTKT